MKLLKLLVLNTNITTMIKKNIYVNNNVKNTIVTQGGIYYEDTKTYWNNSRW